VLSVLIIPHLPSLAITSASLKAIISFGVLQQSLIQLYSFRLPVQPGFIQLLFERLITLL
jgi:hypothetical protein